jgi:hypothetical protein
VSFEKRSVWINPSFILIQLKKVNNLDRENLLQYNTKKQNNRVPLVITYSKALPGTPQT